MAGPTGDETAESDREVVRRVLEAWNRHDVDGLLALCHKGVRFRSLIGAVEGGLDDEGFDHDLFRNDVELFQDLFDEGPVGGLGHDDDAVGVDVGNEERLAGKVANVGDVSVRVEKGLQGANELRLVLVVVRGKRGDGLVEEALQLARVLAHRGKQQPVSAGLLEGELGEAASLRHVGRQQGLGAGAVEVGGITGYPRGSTKLREALLSASGIGSFPP